VNLLQIDLLLLTLLQVKLLLFDSTTILITTVLRLLHFNLMYFTTTTISCPLYTLHQDIDDSG
jgi:hypothetical protein